MDFIIFLDINFSVFEARDPLHNDARDESAPEGEVVKSYADVGVDMIDDELMEHVVWAIECVVDRHEEESVEDEVRGDFSEHTGMDIEAHLRGGGAHGEDAEVSEAPEEESPQRPDAHIDGSGDDEEVEHEVSGAVEESAESCDHVMFSRVDSVPIVAQASGQAECGAYDGESADEEGDADDDGEESIDAEQIGKLEYIRKKLMMCSHKRNLKCQRKRAGGARSFYTDGK